jgi:hypothetical protein
LGIQNLTFNIVTGGAPTALVNPTDNGSGRWSLNGTATVASKTGPLPGSVSYAFTNLVDQGTGNFFPSGAGYAENNLLYDASDTPTNMGLENGLLTTQVITGQYVASSTLIGTNTLTISPTTANYFDDPAVQDDSLVAVAFPALNITNGAISITIGTPEPASIGLLGLASMSLLGIRRRRVA